MFNSVCNLQSINSDLHNTISVNFPQEPRSLARCISSMICASKSLQKSFEIIRWENLKNSKIKIEHCVKAINSILFVTSNQGKFITLDFDAYTNICDRDLSAIIDSQPNLETLMLSGETLTTGLVSKIASLKHLIDLRVPSVLIDRSQIKSVVEALPNLKSLILRGITDGLPAFKKIELHGNRSFGRIGMEVVRRAAVLYFDGEFYAPGRIVQIAQSGILSNSEIGTFLRKCTSLTTIHTLGDISKNIISGISNLKNVENLVFIQCDNLNWRKLKNMSESNSSLKKIRIIDSCMVDMDFQTFSRFNKIQTLGLIDCHFLKDYTFLKHMLNLETLELSREVAPEILQNLNSRRIQVCFQQKNEP